MNVQVALETVAVDVNFSREKLRRVAESLRDWVTEGALTQQPCMTVAETINYRCKCTFQIVWIESLLHFAVRQNQMPVITDTFPIANRRIQLVMSLLQATLNDKQDDFCTIKRNLTSVGFSSAWRDANDSDCLVTLFYDERIEDEIRWTVEASRINVILGVTQVSGRSRKQLLRASENTVTMIHDTLWLVKCFNIWRVFLTDPTQYDECKSDQWIRTVKYEKPEGAFFHPNANAMCTALEWLIQRIDCIHQCNLESCHRKSRLLELYCGCGAHTVALMQTQILESIVAVELDERLVDACQRNVQINKGSDTMSTTETETMVHVVSDDAGVWAKTFVHSGTGIQSDDSDSLYADHFDILLVDPPRQGLDESVCQMVNFGSFKDLLYISCGKDALIRDLDRLACHFQVIDCKLIDLFPQTDAVESLMHLRRKTK